MRRRRIALVAGGMVLAEAVVVARRRGSIWAADTVVRCLDGHLFTTLWIPGASLKAVRLGWWRFQRCPLRPHWTLVTPVKLSQLSQEEKRIASEHHDIRIP